MSSEPTASRPVMDAGRHFPDATHLAATELAGLSVVARGLVGSEILKIAADVRAMKAAGSEICNLTVGDFAPAEFRIPAKLEQAIGRALAAGETNYPPSDGVPELRRAVAAWYERELRVRFPIESILIAGGARPVIYGTYRALLDPGERVLYTLPSWNNNHYAFLTGAQPVELKLGPETGFLPTAGLLAPHLSGVRLLCINTPLNPTGTALPDSEVKAIAELVVAENARRARVGERELYLMWDHVYWVLTFAARGHRTPVELVPEVSPWTIFVDGISKAFAATGLRVGWAVGPPHVISRMRDILGHVGAWAPRPEQMATAELLGDAEALAAYRADMLGAVQMRLGLLHNGLAALKAKGLPVDSIAPAGAIYLSARFDLIGRKIDGCAIDSNEAIRKLLLREAGLAVVPFQAFGLKDETGWMRMSVGAVSVPEIESALPRLAALLQRAG